MNTTETNYYEAKPVDGGYRGRVYKYSPDGETEHDLWLSSKIFDTEDEAIDSASDWADVQGVEIELA